MNLADGRAGDLDAALHHAFFFKLNLTIKKKFVCLNLTKKKFIGLTLTDGRTGDLDATLLLLTPTLLLTFLLSLKVFFF